MPNFDIYGEPIEDCKDFNITDSELQINEDSREDFNLLANDYGEGQDNAQYNECDEGFVREERVIQPVEEMPAGGNAVADDKPFVAEGSVKEMKEEQEGVRLIRLSGVDIFNGGNLILSNVDFEVDRGEFVYIIGKVGSGKSSVIKSLICELPVERGVAEVCGYNLHRIKNREIPYLRREIGVVFQDFQLLMDRSVNDNLEFVLSATGWKRESRRIERVNEVLEMVGLQTKAHKMPHQLSGGEQQRIAIARALLNNPKLILADEPTGNLDKETAHGIMDLLMKIHREEKPAIVMVTHYTELCRDFPGKVMLCRENSLVECKEL